MAAVIFGVSAAESVQRVDGEAGEAVEEEQAAAVPADVRWLLDRCILRAGGIARVQLSTVVGVIDTRSSVGICRGSSAAASKSKQNTCHDG